MPGTARAVSQNTSSPYAASGSFGVVDLWVSTKLGAARRGQLCAAGPEGEVAITYFHILALNGVFPEHPLC